MDTSPAYLGIKDLLKMKKVGFLALRKISTLSMLSSLDLA